MPGQLKWTHRDRSGNLNAAGLAAFAHARTGEPWPEGPEGNRLFRAWLASYTATIANLGPSPVLARTPTEALPESAYTVTPSPSLSASNLDWQQSMVYALAALTWGAQGKRGGDPKTFVLSEDMTVGTIDGEPPELTTPNPAGPGTAALETGIIPAIPIITGLVIVSCIAILAAAVGWITSQVAEVSSVGLQTKSKQTEAVQAMTTAADVVEAHQERETKEARSIPYDEQETALLQTLRETIAQTSGWNAPALRSILKPSDITSPLGKGLGIGEIIFLALGGWALVKYASK